MEIGGFDGCSYREDDTWMGHVLIDPLMKIVGPWSRKEYKCIAFRNGQKLAAFLA